MNSATMSATAKTPALSVIFTISFIFFSISVFAELAVPPLTGRVVDNAGILTSAEKDSINGEIINLEQQTGGQMAVLTIPSLGNDSLESFSMRVAENWKIGHKGKDDGAILIISKADRKIRLEIAYGWEGSINDARGGDIIREMGPYFRSGDFCNGINYAVQSVRSFVKGDPLPPGKTKPLLAGKDGNIHIFWQIFVLIGFIGFILLIIIIICNAQKGNRTNHKDGCWTSGVSSSSSSSSGGVFFGGGGGGGDSFGGGGGSFGGGGASGSW